MESADLSPQDKLDQLLSEGKITDEDYLRLSRAMQKKPDARGAAESAAAASRPPLRKSWANRQIGGVCRGIAEHLGVDPTIVRVFAFVLLCMAPPVTFVAYVVMYYTLPWDDEEAEREMERRGPRRWLASLHLMFSKAETRLTQSGSRFRRLPWQVWMAIALLLLSFLNLLPLTMLERTAPVVIVVLIVNLLLAFGLYLDKRWAFYATLVFSFASVLALGRGWTLFPVVLNMAPGIVLLTACSHFMKRRSAPCGKDPEVSDEGDMGER